MTLSDTDHQARATLARLASEAGLDVAGGKIRRTSSRFCFGVEHGDYNGTELFGIGTDRFIWLAYKPNTTGRIRLLSAKFPHDGIVDFRPGEVPPPGSPEIAHSWARFAFGVDFILRRAGLPTGHGFDAVDFGNIPGGGMSRSASLTLNLILTFFEVNGVPVEDGMQIVDLTQAVETDYIGSPCGKLDQIMIYFARAGMGTHYNPRNRSIQHEPLGSGAMDFRIVSLDTGTVRPGLEKSTYKIRRAECDELAVLAGVDWLAAVREQKHYDQIIAKFGKSHPHLCARLDYLFHAQQRFYQMLKAWKDGRMEEVGRIFREDGIGLRDQYQISGPELETMCDIARTVPGVLGERMLGGGDKGAAGAIVKAESVEALKRAVDVAYPRSRPEYAANYAVHPLSLVDGVTLNPGL